MKLVQIIKECSGFLPAMLIGFYNFRYLSKFARILFLQLLIWILLYVTSYLVTNYQRSHHITQNNHLVFNFNLIVETSLLLFSALGFFSSKKGFYFLLAIYFIFLIVFVVELFTNGPLKYADLSDFIECCIFTSVFTVVLYKIFHDRKTEYLVEQPDIWIIIGLIFYFACSVPYIAFFDALEQTPKSPSKSIFRIIIDFLANIRYWFFAVGLFLYRSYYFKYKLHQND